MSHPQQNETQQQAQSVQEGRSKFKSLKALQDQSELFGTAQFGGTNGGRQITSRDAVPPKNWPCPSAIVYECFAFILPYNALPELLQHAIPRLLKLN